MRVRDRSEVCTRGRGGSSRRGLTAASLARYVEQDEKEAALFEQRARELACAEGLCQTCGEAVDEANGKLHDPWCAVEPHRRRKRPAERLEAMRALLEAHPTAAAQLPASIQGRLVDGKAWATCEVDALEKKLRHMGVMA